MPSSVVQGRAVEIIEKALYFRGSLPILDMSFLHTNIPAMFSMRSG